MKKTISINIGGVIFHIEEDGYEKLKNYLSSVQRYFSTFADSQEIVSDIEARVAERFYNKQKSEAKQVISIEDVEELIKAMGTVADFEAIEQAEDILADPLEVSTEPAFESKKKVEPAAAFASASEEKARFAPNKSRKLYRDLKRKLIGGVAAGLANYFTIDAIWVRLAFLVSVIGLPAGSGMLHLNIGDELGSISGFVTLVYIAMWIAFPGSTSLEEDTTIKKFYRDPDRKVVGGVAAGIASYFGIDLGVARFLWVISILFFGTGLVIYIVLWVISPTANTLTEKMEMQGEPITLSNIESNIKQSLNVDSVPGEENLISKIALFPFRAIAFVIALLGKLLKGIGPVFRILIGSILTGFSALSLLGLVIAGSVAMGLTSSVPFDNLPIPFLIFQELPGSLILSGILLAAIPIVIFLLLGITLVTNRKVAPTSVWLTLAGLWVVGIIGSTIGGISYQRNFAKHGEVIQRSGFLIPEGTLTLESNYYNEENTVDIGARIAGSDAADSLLLEKKLYSRGRSVEDAQNNADKLEYLVSLKDSVMTFPRDPEVEKLSFFRNQRVDVVLYIPFNKPFIMSRDFYFFSAHWGEAYQHIGRYDLDNRDINWKSLRWVMLRDSGLVCTNLPAKFLKSEQDNEDDNAASYRYEDDDQDHLDLGNRGNFIKQFPVSSFANIDLGGAYSISIEYGEQVEVTADGDEEDVNNIRVNIDNGTLKVDRADNKALFSDKKWNRIGLVIKTPHLEKLELSGANKTKVSGFKGLDRLKVDISGSSRSEIEVEANRLDIDVSGASRAMFRGRASDVKMYLSGASKVEARGMQIDKAEVSASGASRADLGQIGTIKKMVTGASKIESH